MSLEHGILGVVDAKLRERQEKARARVEEFIAYEFDIPDEDVEGSLEDTREDGVFFSGNVYWRVSDYSDLEWKKRLGTDSWFSIKPYGMHVLAKYLRKKL